MNKSKYNWGLMEVGEDKIVKCKSKTMAKQRMEQITIAAAARNFATKRFKKGLDEVCRKFSSTKGINVVIIKRVK